MEVIRVENLSKLYDLGQVGTGTLSKDLNRWWANVRRKEDPYARIGQTNDRTKKAGKGDSVWALKDLNFSVNQGDVLGIIGRNGAGKSTLLKIISRITTPSTGSVKAKGRIASLLEVGTGFHPEMTGRENVFMNGTLLGMTRREIHSKLEEIIDFAGVAMYIDTPVKRYSTGMQVRLAFAVAAFLEPEILIVDEVLAVGDAEFQKKAIGRMQDVSRSDGRTILFVSHNILAIKSLCTTGMRLSNGGIAQMGEINDVIEGYLGVERGVSKVKLSNRLDRVGNGIVRFEEIAFYDHSGKEVSEVSSGEDLTIKLKYKSLKPEITNAEVAIAFQNSYGIQIAMISNTILNKTVFELGESGYFIFKVPNLPFVSGSYSLNLFCRVHNEITDWIVNTAALAVTIGDYYRSGKNSDNEQSMFLLNFSYDSES